MYCPPIPDPRSRSSLIGNTPMHRLLQSDRSPNQQSNHQAIYGYLWIRGPLNQAGFVLRGRTKLPTTGSSTPKVPAKRSGNRFTIERPQIVRTHILQATTTPGHRPELLGTRLGESNSIFGNCRFARLLPHLTRQSKATGKRGLFRSVRQVIMIDAPGRRHCAGLRPD
jgi:hypothetical protein